MNCYIDIRIRPDPEFSPVVLMSALFGKLHRVLTAMKVDDLGISLPEHGEGPPRLGGRLRLHGNAVSLERLMGENWMQGMGDHVHVSDIQPVPNDACHRVVRRRQFKTSVERLRRRRAKRHGETMEQVCARIPEGIERKSDLPFVVLRSLSTGHNFSLFIEHGPEGSEPVKGTFNSYGLSKGATVPWF